MATKATTPVSTRENGWANAHMRSVDVRLDEEDKQKSKALRATIFKDINEPDHLMSRAFRERFRDERNVALVNEGWLFVEGRLLHFILYKGPGDPPWDLLEGRKPKAIKKNLTDMAFSIRSHKTKRARK